MTRRAARIEEALVAAAEWRLLGLLLERPRAGWREEVRALATEIRDPALHEAAAGATDAREGEYLALIGPGGLASPREAAYLGMHDPGWLLSELSRFYDAFAFRPRAEDPPDHVAVEAGFVAYLHLKEAFALEGGDVEAAETTAAARGRFLAEHVARIARPLLDGLAPALGTPLGRAAALLAARAPDPPPGGGMPTLDAASDSCGSCGLEPAPRSHDGR